MNDNGATRGQGNACADAGPCCYLKSDAHREACPARVNCTSWSRATQPPAPPTTCPPPPPGACDRGWRWPRENRSGCACTALALKPGAGQVAYPGNASLSTRVWQDRPYPWGGDAILVGTEVHAFISEFANHCPMTYGTWYTSTHIRHAVAPADRDGRPAGPFVARDVAVPRAAGNAVLLKSRTADGYYVMLFTNRPGLQNLGAENGF